MIASSFLANLPLKVRDLSVRGVEHLLRLQYVELSCHAMVQSQRSQFDGAFLRLYRVFRDLEFEIELQEEEVCGRDVAHEGESYSTLTLFGRQELCAGRFGGAPQLAEEVELK